MEKNIYFITDNRLGVLTKGTSKQFESGYIEKYRRNCIAVYNKNKWKNSGFSAMFQGREESSAAEIGIHCSLGNASQFNEDFIYCVTCDEVSAIVKKSPQTEEEENIIHTNNTVFYSVYYNADSAQILCTTSTDRITKDISVFDPVSGDLKTLTSGDSVDDNPSYSKLSGDIYFNSRGIGRDANMNPVGYSNSTIFCINEFSNSFDEIIYDDKFDFIAPKTDAKGNMYYIKKPYTPTGGKGGNLLVDILLMPFRLAIGLGKLLLYLSKLYKKEDRRGSSKTYGNNPAVNKELSQRDLFIYEQNIDIEKQEKINGKRGDKNTGFAPYNFELIKRTKEGEEIPLRRGVLSYDVDGEGNIVFTNGRYIFSLSQDGTETVLHKDRLITRVNF